MGMNFFPSRWPIMCAVMNGVSDLPLACAVHEAGVMPSLMVSWKHPDRDYDVLDYHLKEFVKLTGSANCVLQLDYNDLKDDRVLSMVEHYKFSHIEMLGMIGIPNDRMQHEFEMVMTRYSSAFERLLRTSRVLTRIFTPSSGLGIDSYALKGNESAGFSGNISVKDLFIQQHLQTPHIPEQISWYVNNGAAGVAVGTLFAATHESCLDIKTKQAMVDANSQSLTKLNTSQRALVMGEVSNDVNHQQSLNAGIAGQGGLVYAGSAIDHVTEIRTVKQVVDYLTQDLV
jgi:hypothetical protein